MKYLKKTTALLLSVLLLFSAMVTGATVLADGNTATITVASVEAAAGASIEVPVTISGNDIGGAYFTVDVDGLTVNDVTIGENFKDWGNDELTYALTVAADEAFSGETVLVKLNVAVPADAAEGTVYDITFTDVTVSGWNDDVTDVATTVEAGAVTVKAAEVECKHTNVTSEVTVEATKDAEGVRTFTCECGHTYTQPIAKPAKYTTKSIGGTLVVADKFAYRLGVYTNITNEYASYKLVIDTKYYDGSSYVITDKTDVFTADMKTNESTSTRDYFNVYAAAYAVDFDINATLYFYDAEGNTVYYYEDTYNIASRAKRYVTEADSTTAAGQRTIKFFMDMLNYCAAAQQHFKTDTNGLKDAVLVNEGLEAYNEFASQDVPDYSTVATNDKIKDDTTVATIGKAIIIGESTYIRYNITVPNGTEGLQLKVTYSSSYSNVNDSYVPVVKTVNLSDLPKGDDGRPYLLFTDVTLYDTHVPVKAEIIKNGVTVVENDYNIAYFINSRLGNSKYPDLQNFLTAMSKFAESARVYFGYDK